MEGDTEEAAGIVDEAEGGGKSHVDLDLDLSLRRRRPLRPDLTNPNLPCMYYIYACITRAGRNGICERYPAMS